MKKSRIDVRSIRREQIVEASVAVITEKGLQNLSLAEIETKAGMSRGQLTYYFRTKEDILLAVFDRLLQLMYSRIGTPDISHCSQASVWECVRHLLEKLLQRPPVSPEFHVLQYTFLSQIGYREDFRLRLASLYEEWRTNMAHSLEKDLAEQPQRLRHSPRSLASFVQAILHGLAMQAAADPDAFDVNEMLDLCLDMLNRYISGADVLPKAKKRRLQNTVVANGNKPFAKAVPEE